MKFVNEYGLVGLSECSAKSGENVNAVFTKVTELLCDKFQQGTFLGTAKLEMALKTDPKKKKKCSC